MAGTSFNRNQIVVGGPVGTGHVVIDIESRDVIHTTLECNGKKLETTKS